MKTKSTPTRVLLYSLSALLIGYAAYGVSTSKDSKNYGGAKVSSGYSLAIDGETDGLIITSNSNENTGRSCKDKKKPVANANQAGIGLTPVSFDDEDCLIDECCDETAFPGSCNWRVLRECVFIPEGTCEGNCKWHLVEIGTTDPCPSKSHVLFPCEDQGEGECDCSDIYAPGVNFIPPAGCELALPSGQLPTGDDVMCSITAEDDCDYCVREQPVTEKKFRWNCDYEAP